MGLLNRQAGINFLSLLPGTTLTVLGIAVAFLRFYDAEDFQFLGLIAEPRTWSNRLTLAATLVAVVNFGVEWDRRNRETDRLAEERNRRAEEEQRRDEERDRRAEEEQRRVREEQRRVREEQRRREDTRRSAARRTAEAERAARRARIEARCRAAQIRFQLEPNEVNRQALAGMLAFLEEYGETL
nr:hypothetical protein [Petrachloros mirabilis]